MQTFRRKGYTPFELGVFLVFSFPSSRHTSSPLILSADGGDVVGSWEVMRDDQGVQMVDWCQSEQVMGNHT